MTDDEKRLRTAIRITDADLRVRLCVGLVLVAIAFFHGSPGAAYLGFFLPTVGAAVLRDYILKPILTAIEQGKSAETPEPPPASVRALRVADGDGAAPDDEHEQRAA